jgi:hypothetical protein
MRITRKDVLVAIITNAVLLLGIHKTEAEQASPSLSSAQIIEILASPDRTAADRTNDLRRKPEQMLAFIGIRPGIVALDLSRRWLHDGAAGPFDRAHWQGLRSEPAARSQPSTGIRLRGRGQQPPKSSASGEPSGVSGRAAAVSSHTGRS